MFVGVNWIYWVLVRILRRQTFDIHFVWTAGVWALQPNGLRCQNFSIHPAGVIGSWKKTLNNKMYTVRLFAWKIIANKLLNQENFKKPKLQLLISETSLSLGVAWIIELYMEKVAQCFSILFCSYSLVPSFVFLFPMKIKLMELTNRSCLRKDEHDLNFLRHS